MEEEETNASSETIELDGSAPVWQCLRLSGGQSGCSTSRTSRTRVRDWQYDQERPLDHLVETSLPDRDPHQRSNSLPFLHLHRYLPQHRHPTVHSLIPSILSHASTLTHTYPPTSNLFTSLPPSHSTSSSKSSLSSSPPPLPPASPLFEPSHSSRTNREPLWTSFSIPLSSCEGKTKCLLYCMRLFHR